MLSNLPGDPPAAQKRVLASSRRVKGVSMAIGLAYSRLCLVLMMFCPKLRTDHAYHSIARRIPPARACLDVVDCLAQVEGKMHCGRKLLLLLAGHALGGTLKRLLPML